MIHNSICQGEKKIRVQRWHVIDASAGHHKVCGCIFACESHLTSVMIRPGAPSIFYCKRTHTPKKREWDRIEFQTALYVCVLLLLLFTLSWNRNLIDAGPRARSRQPKMKSCRPVCCIVGSSRRCVSFQGRYDSPYRSNWCFIAPVTASADKCFFFLLLPFFFTLYLSFEKRRRKYQTFFFLSYSTDHYRYRILWFFSSVFGGCLNDDDPAPGHQRNRDKRWLVIFFCCCWLNAIWPICHHFFITWKIPFFVS